MTIPLAPHAAADLPPASETTRRDLLRTVVGMATAPLLAGAAAGRASDTFGAPLAAQPIPGTTQPIQLADGFAGIAVHGARTTEPLLRMTDVGAKLGTSSRDGFGLSPLPTTR